MPHSDIEDSSQQKSRQGGRFKRVLPLAVFVVIVIFLGIGLTLNPREIPSPLIGKPVPKFSLPPVLGRDKGLSDADLKGEVSLVNVFASWCAACRQEHPLLMELSRKQVVPIHGLNYKDEPEDAANWLRMLGDPYTRIGSDLDGRVGIEWGVYGVPETFIIDRNGYIAHKHIGPISVEDWEEELLPMIQRLRKSPLLKDSP